MVTRDKLCDVVGTKGYLVKLVLSSLLVLTASCAPTLSGQLHAPVEGPFSDEARINVTELSAAPGASGAEVPLRTVILPVSSDGKFTTKEKLPPGEYLVEALVPGYAAQSQKINLAQTSRIELTLQPLPPAKVRAMHLNSGLEEGRGAGGATLTPPSL